ncbi:MAG: exosortase H [Bryobacteraceae bacterium]
MARKPSPSHTRAMQAEEASAPPRKNRMLRFLVLFPILLAVGFCGLLIPFLHPVVTGFTRGLVEISAIVIRLFGGNATAHQVVLRNPSNGFAMEVLDVCNGDDVTVLLWAAILAYPASWLQKGEGLLAGTVAIHVINFLRVISLFYLGQYNRQWFEFAHQYVWESVFVLLTLTIFWTWVRRMAAPRLEKSKLIV